MSVDEPLRFRWLGLAGIELAYRSQILAIDPFFTRPPLRQMVWGRPQPDATLAAEKLPECHYILVSHPHYDHLMDAPAIALNTGAALYGSANTCRIASVSGVSDEQIHEVAAGELLHLGEFEVQCQGTQYTRTPVDQWLNGALYVGERQQRLFGWRLRSAREGGGAIARTGTGVSKAAGTPPVGRSDNGKGCPIVRLKLVYGGAFEPRFGKLLFFGCEILRFKPDFTNAVQLRNSPLDQSLSTVLE